MKPFRHATDVQTLVFCDEVFTRGQAKAWAKAHGFKYGDAAIEVTSQSTRIRQHPPTDYRRSTFRTIELTDGVKAVVGVPVKAARAERPAGYDSRGPVSNPKTSRQLAEMVNRPLAVRPLPSLADLVRASAGVRHAWSHEAFVDAQNFLAEGAAESAQAAITEGYRRARVECTRRANPARRSNPYRTYRGVSYYGSAGVYRTTLPNSGVKVSGLRQDVLKHLIDEDLASTPARRANPTCAECNGEGQLLKRHSDGLYSWVTCPSCEGWGGSRMLRTHYPDGTVSKPTYVHPKKVKNPALHAVHDIPWFLAAVQDVAHWARGMAPTARVRALLRALKMPSGGDRGMWAGELLDLIQREASYDSRVVDEVGRWLPFLS